jgi:hypothetical protein
MRDHLRTHLYRRVISNLYVRIFSQILKEQ